MLSFHSGICQTMEVAECKGEATAKQVSCPGLLNDLFHLVFSLSLSLSNRKGKLIFFYEWAIKLKWKGTLTPEDPPTNIDNDDETVDQKEYSGEIEIPNLSEENDPEDIDVSVAPLH